MNSFNRHETADQAHRVALRPTEANAAGSSNQPLLFANLTHSPAPAGGRSGNFSRRASDRALLAKLRRSFGFGAPAAEPNLLDFIKRSRP